MIKVADLFCGAGGENTGILQAVDELGGPCDLAAVNHWDVAMETHRRNHPAARSFCMGLEQLNPLDVFGARDRIDLLWASPECTHHSNARTGRVNKAHKSFLVTAYYDGRTIEQAREIIERGGYDHLSQETIDVAVAEIKGCTGYDWVRDIIRAF